MECQIGIVRIERLRLMEGCEGLIEPSKLGQREGLVDQCGDAIRPQGNGLVEPCESVFAAGQQLQRRADIVAGLVIGRVQRVRPQKIGQGLLVSLHLEAHEATLFENGRLVRPLLVAEIDVGQRFVRPSELEESAAVAIDRVGLDRIELQDVPIAREAFAVPFELPQHIAVLDPQCDVVGPQLQRPLQRLERDAVEALLLQRDAETAEIIRLGVLPAGALDPRDRVVVLPGMQVQKTHQMQGFRMIGFGRERLLAAKLRIQKAAGLHMLEGEVAKCGRRGRAGTCRSLLDACAARRSLRFIGASLLAQPLGDSLDIRNWTRAARYHFTSSPSVPWCDCRLARSLAS